MHSYAPRWLAVVVALALSLGTSSAVAECSGDETAAVASALSSCAAAVGLSDNAMPWLQLMSYLKTNESLVRSDYCSNSTLSPGCDALAALSQSKNNCTIWLYKGTTFHAPTDVPKICATPWTTAVNMSFYSAIEKALDVVNGTKLVVRPANHSAVAPSFLYNATSRLVQFGATNSCIDAFPKDGGFRVHLWPCSRTNANQLWHYEPALHRLKHWTHPNLCLDADPTNPLGEVQAWPCHDLNVNANQYFAVDPPQWKVAYSYDRDFTAADSRNFPALTPSICVSVCEFDTECTSFAWFQGVCYLKKGPGAFVDKTGVVSAKLDKCNNLQMNVDIGGNDIGATKGAKESCCHACQATAGCQAFSWNSYEGGTCWLKSSSTSVEWKADTWSGWV